MNTVEELIGRAVVSIQKAESLVSKIDKSILEMEGMSSPKVRHFYNNICSYPDTRYLEVGTAGGSTIISALYNNTPQKALGMDLFLELKNGVNGREKFISNCEQKLGRVPQEITQGDSDFAFYTGDCFQFDNNLVKNKFNVYMYDAGHEIEDHRLAMLKFLDVLEDRFIMIIDDWNDHRVQQGTQLGLQESGLKVRFSNARPARIGATPPSWGDLSEWWNGTMILVLEK